MIDKVATAASIMCHVATSHGLRLQFTSGIKMKFCFFRGKEMNLAWEILRNVRATQLT